MYPKILKRYLKNLYYFHPIVVYFISFSNLSNTHCCLKKLSTNSLLMATKACYLCDSGIYRWARSPDERASRLKLGCGWTTHLFLWLLELSVLFQVHMHRLFFLSIVTALRTRDSSQLNTRWPGPLLPSTLLPSRWTCFPWGFFWWSWVMPHLLNES